MVRQLAAALVPALVGLTHRRQQGGFVGVGVEQRFLVLRFEQQLMGVLAVDLDQALPQLAQLRQGTAVPLIKLREQLSALITLRSRHSLLSSSLFCSSHSRADGVSASEKRAQMSARAAPSKHHVAVGAVAEAQPQRIDGDGFAGAGFTGDRRHASG